jgi:hypothetical protein
MHWCLLRSSLDMSKPSQTMLHKLLLNWRHSYPLSYIIIPDSVKILKLTFKRQIGQYSCYDRHAVQKETAGQGACGRRRGSRLGQPAVIQ